MRNLRVIVSIAIISSLFDGCSSNKNYQTEITIKEFLNGLQKQIANGDSTVLKVFRTTQKPEVFLSVLKALQNKEKHLVVCSPKFEEAVIEMDENGVVVKIPVILASSIEGTERESIVINLTRKDKHFYITKFDGEVVHNKYNYFKWRVVSAQKQAECNAHIRKHIDRVSSFKSKFDSIAWFVDYKDKTYFYILKHDIDSLGQRKNLMGLLDETGQTIIPAEFDLISSPEIVMKNIFEVHKGGKIGYYSISGVELAEPLYDYAIPYTTPNIAAIAKMDTTIGWLDKDFLFHQGFPNTEAKLFFQNLQFLSTPIVYTAKDLPLCSELEIVPMRYGLIIPPAYLVRFGLFPQLLGGFSFEGFDPYFSSTEKIEKKSFDIFALSENVRLLITNFKTRYLGGRTEFYSNNRITLVNHRQDTLSTSEISGGESVILARKSESLLEAKMTDSNWYGPPEANILGYPGYRYFEFDGNRITPKESKRDWPMTEFVKLDSSYFKGEFQFFDYPDQAQVQELKMKPTSFVTREFLEAVRKDMLMHLGYAFTDPNTLDELQYRPWYKPLYPTYQEMYDASGEIDKHNLNFIESLIGPYSSPPVQ